MAEDVLVSESRGACVVFVALVFFNFIRSRRVPHKRPSSVCAAERWERRVYGTRSSRTESITIHRTLGYPMTRTMIYILSIDNEAAIIKAITSHRTLLKTFLIRPEKHAPKIRLSHIFDRHRTLSPVLCVEVSKYFLLHHHRHTLFFSSIIIIHFRDDHLFFVFSFLFLKKLCMEKRREETRIKKDTHTK